MKPLSESFVNLDCLLRFKGMFLRDFLSFDNHWYIKPLSGLLLVSYGILARLNFCDEKSQGYHESGIHVCKMYFFVKVLLFVLSSLAISLIKHNKIPNIKELEYLTA